MFAYSLSAERFCDFLAATAAAPRGRVDLGPLTVTHGTIDKHGPVILVQGVSADDFMLIAHQPILEDGLTQRFGDALSGTDSES